MQVVGGIDGGLIFDLNAWAGGLGTLLEKAGPDIADGRLAGTDTAPVWSPQSGPAGLGRRTITIPIVAAGSTVDDLGVRVASLMAAVRGPWWLKVRRHGATTDSWLRCYGCVPQIATDIVAGSLGHLARGTIVAETDPYAYGARVDQAAVAVSQNPTVSTAWRVDVNSVQGDSLTPVLLRMQDATAHAQPLGAFISCRRRGTPSNLSADLLRTLASNGGNTREVNSGMTWSILEDAGFFSGGTGGGSGWRLTLSGAYPALNAASFKFVAPSLVGADVPGTYRMFARIRRSGGAATKRYVLKPFATGGSLNPQDITIPVGVQGSTDIRVVDLGLVQWPTNRPPGLGAPTPVSGASPTSVYIQVWGLDSGAGIIDFDWLAWVPADEDGGFFYLEDSGVTAPSTQWLAVDGYSNQGVLTDSDPVGAHNIVGQAYGPGQEPSTVWLGRAPRLRPGDNRVFIVPGLSQYNAWPKTRTWNVAVSYWPRFTWLR
jgi:hypothetical protein